MAIAQKTRPKSKRPRPEKTHLDERGRLRISEPDIQALHALVRDRPEGKSVNDVCKGFIKSHLKGVKGATPNKLYSQVYLYDELEVKRGQRFVDTKRSRDAVKGRQKRAGRKVTGKATFVTPPTPAPKKPSVSIKVSRGAAPALVEPTNHAEAITAHVHELEAAAAAANARAAKVEAENERLMKKLERIRSIA